MNQLAAPYERDGVLVLAVAGEFDVGNAADLERYISEVSAPGKPLILDFSDTGYIDSSVLAVLIRRKKAAGSKTGFVVPAGSKVHLIFDVAGLLDVLGIAASVDEAVLKLDDSRLGDG